MIFRSYYVHPVLMVDVWVNDIKTQNVNVKHFFIDIKTQNVNVKHFFIRKNTVIQEDNF